MKFDSGLVPGENPTCVELETRPLSLALLSPHTLPTRTPHTGERERETTPNASRGIKFVGE